jgi:hypothetical protein
VHREREARCREGAAARCCVRQCHDGNIVLLGVAAGDTDLWRALSCLAVVASYVAGGLGGIRLTRRGQVTNEPICHRHLLGDPATRRGTHERPWPFRRESRCAKCDTSEPEVCCHLASRPWESDPDADVCRRTLVKPSPRSARSPCSSTDRRTSLVHATEDKMTRQRRGRPCDVGAATTDDFATATLCDS